MPAQRTVSPEHEQIKDRISVEVGNLYGGHLSDGFTVFAEEAASKVCKEVQIARSVQECGVRITIGIEIRPGKTSDRRRVQPVSLRERAVRIVLENDCGTIRGRE